jgi:hypothetical protein
VDKPEEARWHLGGGKRCGSTRGFGYFLHDCLEQRY